MKKLLLSLSFVAGSLVSLSAQNLLNNGDFEGLNTLHQPKTGSETIDYSTTNPDAPYVGTGFNFTPGDTEWRLKKPNTGYIRTDFYAAEEVNAGTQSLKLAVNKGYTTDLPWYNNAVYRAISVDRNTKYEVTLWAKGIGQLFVQFFSNSNGTNIPIGGQPSKVLDGTEEWAQYTFSLDVAARDNSAITDESVFTDKTIFALGLKTTGAETAENAKVVCVDNVELKTVDPVGINETEQDAAIYVNDGTIYFNINEAHKVSVYSAIGTLVASKTIAPGESLPISAKGCLIIKLENGKGLVKTQKTFLQ